MAKSNTMAILKNSTN